MKQRFKHISLRLQRRFGQWPMVFVVASVVGLLTGGCAALLKWSVACLSRWVTGGFRVDGDNWLLMILPVIGLTISVALCQLVFRKNISHGVRKLKQRLSRHDAFIPPQGIYAPFIASTATLGFGGSAGSEGPIACIGAAIASNLGRWSRMRPSMMILLVGCGAGAGIAGIFKAPLGGALFTLEVLGIGLTATGMLAVVTSSLIAGLTAYLLGGNVVDMAFDSSLQVFRLSHVGWALMLGVVCGLFSLYYSYFMKKVEHWLDRVSNPWVKALLAGGLLGGLLFLFPSLYGEGYDTIGRIINGRPETLLNDSLFFGGSLGVLLAVAVLTALMKCFATSLTNNGGGVSGDFAPTLFAGSVVGLSFVLIANSLFGASLPVGLFAYLGLAGVMAGAIRAPLMAIFLVCEMTGAYTLLLPLALVAAVSFAVVRLFTFDDYYDKRLDRPNGLAASRLTQK